MCFVFFAKTFKLQHSICNLFKISTIQPEWQSQSFVKPISQLDLHLPEKAGLQFLFQINMSTNIPMIIILFSISETGTELSIL